MNRVKAVVFGLRNLVLNVEPGSHEGRLDLKSVKEFGKLVALLRERKISPIIFANDHWTTQGPPRRPTLDLLREEWGELQTFITSRDGMPKKPRAEAMAELLKRIGCEQNEVLYIGNSENDMQTAVNGGVLFLNGTWMRADVPYGFRFPTVKDIAKFIDVFCVRDHAWHFSIDAGPLRYFALAPFSTMFEKYENYSADAKRAAKQALGTPEFWGKYLCATLFLSGLHNEFDYVCPFPSHSANQWNQPLKESIESFAKCFRQKYLPDLVLRHTTALKSQHNRDAMDHLQHLNTLHITKNPIKTAKLDRYASPPLKRGKTVLVIDDFCTRGFSLEAARAYLERAGASVILVTWLKTINRSYSELVSAHAFDPYRAQNWSAVRLQTRDHAYHHTISDDQAAAELKAKFEKFQSWDWPG